MFFFLSKLNYYFQVSFNLNVILSMIKNNSEHHDWALSSGRHRGSIYRSFIGRSVGRSVVRADVRSVGSHSIGLAVRPIARSMEPPFLPSFVHWMVRLVHPSVSPSKIATLTIGKGASFSYATNSSSSDSSSSSSSSDVESRLSLLWVFSLRDCNL